jgi:hypothetical protein
VTDGVGIPSLQGSVNIKVLTPTVNVNLVDSATRPKTVAVRFSSIPAVFYIPHSTNTRP